MVTSEKSNLWNSVAGRRHRQCLQKLVESRSGVLRANDAAAFHRSMTVFSKIIYGIPQLLDWQNANFLMMPVPGSRRYRHIALKPPTFDRWRQVRKLYNFKDNDSLVKYLLDTLEWVANLPCLLNRYRLVDFFSMIIANKFGKLFISGPRLKTCMFVLIQREM